MVRMNKNSVGPQQRVEMRVLPYVGGILCFSLLWLDRILEPKHLLDTCRKDETKERRRSFDVFLLMFEVGKVRKIHPILSSLTSTPPTPGASIGDVNRNLASSIFLSFPTSFINGKASRFSFNVAFNSFRPVSRRCFGSKMRSTHNKEKHRLPPPYGKTRISTLC